MDIKVGDKALLTTDNWFVAPDGATYQAIYGTIKGIFTDVDTLGIKTNAKSTNWYIEIGNMCVAGCQVHYAIKTEKCYEGRGQSWSADAANGLSEFSPPSRIYFADNS